MIPNDYSQYRLMYEERKRRERDPRKLERYLRHCLAQVYRIINKKGATAGTVNAR